MEFSMKLRRIPSRTKAGRPGSSSCHTARTSAKSSRKTHCSSALSGRTSARGCVCIPQMLGPVEFPSVWTEFRDNGQLCDGIVRTEDGVEFMIHRAILSAVSPYFKVIRLSKSFKIMFSLSLTSKLPAKYAV